MFQLIYISFFICVGFNLCDCYEKLRHLSHTSSTFEAREELVLTNVEVEKTFKLQSNISIWKSITMGPVCYSIGWINSSVTMLLSTANTNSDAFDVKIATEDIGRTLTDAIIIHSRMNGRSEFILLTSFIDSPEIEWYKIDDLTLKKIWSWTLHKPVYHLNSFMMSRRAFLLVILGTVDSSSLSLFEFDIKTSRKKYWFLHSDELSLVSNSTAINKQNDCYYLSVAQEDVALIYKFSDNHLVHHKYIKSPGVSRVISFDIMFKTFIAIDGHNAGIFEFDADGDIARRRIMNSNLDGFNYWLPIPLNTLRDEIVLLAQRTLDHGSHKSYVVEFVTFNGVDFQEHEDIPCDHFGEKVQWLTCLTDDNGIIGSAFVAVEEMIGLVVPRIKNSRTLLFNFQYDIKQNENPLKRDLEYIEQLRQKLERDIEFIDNLRTEPSTISKPRNIVSTNIVGMASWENISEYMEFIEEIGNALDKLEKRIDDIIEFENNTEYEKVIINAHFTIEGEAHFEELEVEKINAAPATALLDDIVRKDNISQILGNKTFTDLHANIITFETINGVRKRELIFKSNDSITINGNLTIQSSVTVGNMTIITNKLNDIDLDDFVSMDRSHEGEIKFEKVNITDTMHIMEINDENLEDNLVGSAFNDSNDTFHVPENLTVVFINGINFTDFVQNICMVDVKCLIPGAVRIDGDVTVHEEAIVHFLNNLRFPEDFIFINDDASHAVVTGRKVFEHLIAQEIRLSGTINDLDTSKLITLSTDQFEIPGNITFTDLEPTEELNVTGDIQGKHLDKFLPNLTLNETDVVESNVNFRRLEVVGTIFVEDMLNNNNFNNYLSDVIYNDEENVTVTGNKDFSMGLTVDGGISVESQKINNINIDSLVTKHTPQTLNMNVLNGNVKIHKLLVKTLYDDINITQLDESLVKLSGEQFISSTLIFTDDIEVKNLEMFKLNDIPPNEYIYASEGFNIKENIEFQNISVEWLYLDGDLHSNRSTPDLDGIKDKYLSISKNQTITQPWILPRADAEQFEVGNIDLKIDDGLFNKTAFEILVENVLGKKGIHIENLHIGGSVDADKLDGDTDILSNNPFVKSRDKREHITVLGDAYFDDIVINSLSNVSWAQLISSLVFKNETNVDLGGTQTFVNGIRVRNLVETNMLNNISVGNILTLEGVQTIKGPIAFHGDVEVDEMTLKQNINGIEVSEIFDHLKVVNGSYILNGDKLFSRLIHIRDLTIDGLLNGKSVDDILSGVVYLDSDHDFIEDFTFSKNVSISGNLAITGFVNNISYKEVVPKIVLITQDSFIEGPITFEETVLVSQKLVIDEDLDTGSVFGFNSTPWLDDAIFVDRGLINGSFLFEHVNIRENLETIYINDTNVNTFIPLRTNQTINHLRFGKVMSVENITVGNLVNGLKLPIEYGRTVMRDLNQQIHSDIIFQNHVLIREELKTRKINGKLASNIITTHTDQTLLGNYNFIAKTSVDGNLRVSGFINGIDISRWQKSSVVLSSSEPQKIENRWDISGDVNIDNNVSGGGIIGNLTKLAAEVRDRMLRKLELEDNVLKDYKGICTDLKYMHNIAKKQIYRFKYLENMQRISYPYNVRNTFSFEYNNNHYLLVNDENCLSHLLQFDGEGFYPVMEKIETGRVSQIVPVRENRKLFIVLRGDSVDPKCSIQGTNMWEVIDNNLHFKYTIDPLYLAQESRIPGTFYGISDEGVIEYKANSMGFRKLRKWNVKDDDAAFVPRGLHAGLALRTGKNMVFLERFQNDTSIDAFDGEDMDTESIITGKARAFPNPYLPGRNGKEVLVFAVGITGHKRDVVAVIEDSNRIDSLIKIYSNPTTGELMQQVPAVRPSSLISLEFDQGETMLAFLENNNFLQIYEYKGILGFQHRSTTKMQGNKLFVLTLPVEPFANPRQCLGVINENDIRLYVSIMDGNRLTDKLDCDL